MVTLQAALVAVALTGAGQTCDAGLLRRLVRAVPGDEPHRGRAHRPRLSRPAGQYRPEPAAGRQVRGAKHPLLRDAG